MLKIAYYLILAMSLIANIVAFTITGVIGDAAMWLTVVGCLAVGVMTLFRKLENSDFEI